MAEIFYSICRIETALRDGPVEVAPLGGGDCECFPGDCGAENIFLGRTRMETHPEFGPLRYLEYEIYEPMAEKLMHAMCREAGERFDCRAIRMAHSFGRVDPGLASVVIQAATPHRGESFEATRYLIDRLKHELPIWKREVWERGETFVQGCTACHAHKR